MKITVTEKHIQTGTRLSIYCCPVALAIKERTGVANLSVTPCYVRIGEKAQPVPAEVENFIMRFDNYQAVKPFTFELSVDEVTK